MTIWNTGQHKMTYCYRYGWQNLGGHSLTRFNSSELFVPTVLIESARLNSFIVLCNGVESDFMAWACKLGTTELTNFQVNLTPGPGRRLFRARPASPRTSALKRSMLMLGPATSWQPGWRGGRLVLRHVTNLPSQVLKQYTNTVTIV